MRMNKDKLNKVINDYPLWRSAYGNVYGIGGREMPDVKATGNSVVGILTPFMSTDDESFQFVYPYLDKMFPNKTKYELDK